MGPEAKSLLRELGVRPPKADYKPIIPLKTLSFLEQGLKSSAQNYFTGCVEFEV